MTVDEKVDEEISALRKKCSHRRWMLFVGDQHVPGAMCCGCLKKIEAVTPEWFDRQERRWGKEPIP